MTLFSNPRERTRFFRFSAVGFTGAAVDFAVFNLFLGVVGLEPIVSQALSFIAAVTSNFILNRHWTYPDSRSKPLYTQVGQYVLVNFIGLLIRTPLFNGLGTIFERALAGAQFPFSLTPYLVAHNLALAASIGAVLLWNYFVNRKWTFNDV